MDSKKSKRNAGRYYYQREYVIYDPQGKQVWRGKERENAIDLTFVLNVKRDELILSGKLIVSIEERKRALMREEQRRRRARERGELPAYEPDYSTPLEHRVQQREYGNRYRARQHGEDPGLTKRQREAALERKRANSRERTRRYRERKKERMQNEH